MKAVRAKDIRPARARVTAGEKIFRDNVYERLNWLESRCDDLEEVNAGPKRFVRNFLRFVFFASEKLAPLAAVVAVVGMVKGWW